MENGPIAEISRLMGTIFGESTVKILKENYEDEEPQKVINLAHKMLSDFMGEKNADKLVEDIIKKFPKLKLKLH